MLLLISGEENFLSQKKLSQIKDKFVSENKGTEEMSEFDEKDFDVSDFSQKVLTVPFFEEKKIILVKNISKAKLSEKDKDRTIETINNIPESSIVIFFEKDKLNQKDKVIKKIASSAKKSWNFEKIETRNIASWVKKEVRARGCEIEDMALSKFVSFVENDLWQINQEVEKLTLYKRNKKITQEDVDKIVSVNISTNIFKLIDFIGERNKNKAISELTKLLDKGEDPIYLLGMIIYQLKNMLIIKEMISKGMPKGEIVKGTKKHPFVVEKTMMQVKNFSPKELENIYNKIFETEMEIKKGKFNPKIKLTVFIAKLCS